MGRSLQRRSEHGPAPKIETEVQDPDTELDVTPHH